MGQPEEKESEDFGLDKDEVELTLWVDRKGNNCQIGTTKGDMLSHDVIDISHAEEALDYWEDKGWNVQKGREVLEKIRGKP